MQLSYGPAYKWDTIKLTKWINESIKAIIPPITENSSERLEKIASLFKIAWYRSLLQVREGVAASPAA